MYGNKYENILNQYLYWRRGLNMELEDIEKNCLLMKARTDALNQVAHLLSA
jgi:hypothetical protein